MRLLVIIDSFEVGGAEQSLAAMTGPLRERGIEVHVARIKTTPGSEAEIRPGGATVHSLSGPGGRFGTVVRGFELIRSIKPDLVHTTLFEADVAGRTSSWLARLPVVSSFVTDAYGPEHVHAPEFRPWKVRAVQLADAATARVVTRFHAVSQSSADLMSRRLKVSRHKIEVIPRGRDPQQLGARTLERRAETRQALGIAPEVPLVLGAGRHYHVKGLDVLAEAFSRVAKASPEAQLMIAGREGPSTPLLKRAITAGGIGASTTLLGYRSDLPDLLCAADVFVLPSRAEGSPGVLIEAMALETPAVATDIPSVAEVSGAGRATMLRVPSESPEELAAAIIRMLDDPVLASSLAADAHARFVDNYTIDAITNQTVGLYRRCIAIAGR